MWSEKIAGHKKVDVKKWAISCGIVMLLALLIAIFNRPEPKEVLSETYDEAEVLALAEQAVTAFIDGDFQKMLDMMTEEYASENSVKLLEEKQKLVQETYGEYKKIQGMESIGGTDPKTGEEYGGALVELKYKRGVVRVSIGFNQELKMRQFLILERK